MDLGEALKQLKAFCDRQVESHKKLGTEDKDYSEYHRGAENSYWVVRKRLEKLDQLRFVETPDVPDGWQGTQPAEGSRRHLLYGVMLKLSGHEEPCESCLAQADAVESALLKSTIAAEETGGAADDFDYAKRCDELIEEREQARASEDTFKSQRDASLNLLRWLIGDLLPSPASFPPGGPDPDRFLDEIGEIGETLTQINNKLDKA